MRTEDRKVRIGSELAARRARLSISYSAKDAQRRHERRIMCLGVGTPPVTPVEVDLMHSHLEAAARGNVLAHNDNVCN